MIPGGTGARELKVLLDVSGHPALPDLQSPLSQPVPIMVDFLLLLWKSHHLLRLHGPLTRQ
jgi:hypothetical protein